MTRIWRLPKGATIPRVGTPSGSASKSPASAAAHALRQSEDEFREAVRGLAEWKQWVVYYVPDSRWTDVRGWPDLVLARGGVVLFRELKAEKGRLSKEQQWWLDQLTASGADAKVWRPSDWEEIEETLNASD